MAFHGQEQKVIDSAVMDMGNSALQLIRRFLSGRITRDELVRGISSFQVNDFMVRHWALITSDPVFVPHWHVLQILAGLSEDIDYQIREHGPATLHEDIKEMALNMKYISAQEAID